MSGLENGMYAYHPFKHDPKRHKSFKRASRHVLSKSKHAKALPILTLSSGEADLLRKGLAPFDMDDRVSLVLHVMHSSMHEADGCTQRLSGKAILPTPRQMKTPKK